MTNPSKAHVNLAEMVAKHGIAAIAEHFGVEDRTVRRWCNVAGIAVPCAREYRAPAPRAAGRPAGPRQYTQAGGLAVRPETFALALRALAGVAT